MLSSGAGGAVETWAGDALANYAIQEGFSGATTALTNRAAASGLGGGAGGPIAAGTLLYFTNPNATAEDYAGKMTRSVAPSVLSSVAGSVLGGLAAGGEGAAAGTEFPIVGNIVGFVVGSAFITWPTPPLATLWKIRFGALGRALRSWPIRPGSLRPAHSCSARRKKNAPIVRRPNSRASTKLGAIPLVMPISRMNRDLSKISHKSRL
jgi:hypothetical protein